ncbi:MAG: metallophosphoesterase family protein [Candidatus Asgardarchaeum sp.]
MTLLPYISFHTLFIMLFVCIIIVALTIYSLYVFPWITGYLKLEVQNFNIKENSRILIISDLHIKYKKQRQPNLDKLLKIIREKEIDTLIIAGDFLDNHLKISLNQLKNIVIEGLSKIGVDKFANLRVFYVMSLSSHDPIINDTLIEFEHDDSLKVTIVRGALKITIGNCNFLVLHGDYAARNGAVARFINLLMLKLRKQQLYIEKLLKRKLQLSKNEWLIMGHTHIAGIDYKYKVANCGSWSGHLGRFKTETALFLEKGCRFTLLQL